MVVLSPSWAASTTCRAELEHAANNAKRILPPGVQQHPGASALPEIVASSDCSPWRSPAVAEAIGNSTGRWTTTRNGFVGITRWLQPALDWDRRGRPPGSSAERRPPSGGRTLAGRGRQPHREPGVSLLHQDYIGSSRRHRWFAGARELLNMPGNRDAGSSHRRLRGARDTSTEAAPAGLRDTQRLHATSAPGIPDGRPLPHCVEHQGWGERAGRGDLRKRRAPATAFRRSWLPAWKSRALR